MRVFVGVGVVGRLAAAGWFGCDYLTAGRFMVTTDDAYVRAYNTTLGAKVAGYVSEFPVEDNTKVQAGGRIAPIYDRHDRLAVNPAPHQIATQAATVEPSPRHNRPQLPHLY